MDKKENKIKTMLKTILIAIIDCVQCGFLSLGEFVEKITPMQEAMVTIVASIIASAIAAVVVTRLYV